MADDKAIRPVTIFFFLTFTPPMWGTVFRRLDLKACKHAVFLMYIVHRNTYIVLYNCTSTWFWHEAEVRVLNDCSSKFQKVFIFFGEKVQYALKRMSISHVVFVYYIP